MFIRFFYTLLLTLVSPFFLYSLYKSKPNKPKFGKRFKEHFGFTPKLIKNGEQTVWFHTVSVGEAIAATPLINAYHLQHPNHAIVVTSTTSTGAEQVMKIGSFVEHRYMPVDFSWAIQRFIKTIKANKLFIMETELWPNTLAIAAKNNIEITILNARLSARSARRYQKFQSIFNLLSNNIHQVLCQTQDDADRFLSLGMEVNKIKVTGSLKFDINIPQEASNSGLALREKIGHKRPVWIVASTHQGEDEIILAAHQVLLRNNPTLLLMIVPRHPERFNQVYTLSQALGLKTILRTSSNALEPDTQVYIADTMGEMLLLISAADICFMGGSLLGDKVGGHNLLEPAALAKPCLTGPSYYNFKQITEQLIQVNACFLCADSNSIAIKINQLINNKTLQKTSGDAALQIVNANKGALKKTLSYL